MSYANGDYYGSVCSTIRVTVLFNILDSLVKQNSNYNFLLFSNPSYNLIYHKFLQIGAIPPNLKTDFLSIYMIEQQRQQFLDSLPKQFTDSVFKVNLSQQDIEDIATFTSSTSSAYGFETVINNKRHYAIYQPLQVIMKNTKLTRIDNYYTFMDLIDEDSLNEKINNMNKQLELPNIITLVVSITGMALAIIMSFRFALNFAQSIEKPIEEFAELIYVIGENLFNKNDNTLTKDQTQNVLQSNKLF